MTMQVERETSAMSIRADLRDETFIVPPRERQRRALVDGVLAEAVAELEHLDELASRLVPGKGRPAQVEDWRSAPATFTDDELLIDGQQVMQAWETPLMREMAKRAAGSGGDILEIGFGMGISATFIQDLGVRSHTIVEPNEAVSREFERWRGTYPDRDIRLVRGKWQDVVDQLEVYDGIFYDTYPTSEAEHLAEPTKALDDDPFYRFAATLLRPTGVFTYYTDEVDSLSRQHQRFLLRHFDVVEISVVRGLETPPDCTYWWADSMAVVAARMPRAAG